MKIEVCYGKDYVFIDVRSPKEFAEDHIPGAINIPLFSNEERAIVGTLYKQVGKDIAINKGLEIVGEKLPSMIQAYQEFKENKIIVYCWRGGMRSGSVVGLLKNIHFDVEQLEQGYKDYRRFVREELAGVRIPLLVVLYGVTGVGKTEALQMFHNSIDLEGIAQHRGSVFGDMGLQKRSQKMFDSLLLHRILSLQKEQFIFIEGEARKIGDIMIPLHLWDAMQKGKKIKIHCAREERVERIYREYSPLLNTPIVLEKIASLQKYLGKKKVQELSLLIQEGKIKVFIELILEEYYDQLYSHSLEQKKYDFVIQGIEELQNISV